MVHGFEENFAGLFRPVNRLEWPAIAKQNQLDVKLLLTANFVKPRLKIGRNALSRGGDVIFLLIPAGKYFIVMYYLAV